MAINTSFMSKRIERMPSFFVLFSSSTKMPFLVCDEESGEDQVFLFAEEDRAKDAVRSFGNYNYLLHIVRIEKRAMPVFFSSLYALGADTVVVQDEGAPVSVKLETLSKRPDIEQLRGDKIPRANPELQITSCYFLQELRRGGERTAEEKKLLRELEEEMAHNLIRSRFIIGFDTTGIKGRWDPKDPAQKARVSLVKRSDGAVYQPLFTEFGEFQKFYAKQAQKGSRMNLIAAPYEKLIHFLYAEAQGYAINPGGFNLTLTREQLNKLRELYGS